MADTTTAVLGFDTTAFNTRMGFALRPELYFDSVASVDTSPATHVGTAIQFPLMTEMTANSTPLTEGTDVTPQTLADSNVTVTLAEYGNTINYTAKVQLTSFMPLDEAFANLLGFNAGISMDTVALAILAAGTNVQYGGAAVSRVTVAAGHIIDTPDVRLARARLAAANVRPFIGTMPGSAYRAFIHPDVAYDLKGETGEAGWLAPMVNSNVEPILSGLLGRYHGFDFIETPRATLRADAGVGGTVDVYDTYFVGDEAIAKGYSTGTHLNGAQMGRDPITVAGPIVDSLYRERPMGWYQLAGYGIYRQAAIRRLESSSSIGTN